MFNNTTNDICKPSDRSLLQRTSRGNRLSPLVTCMAVAILITGCASTNVTTHPQMSANEQLPRPDHIWVYDFEPTAAGQAAVEQAEIGKEIANQLTQNIRNMGLPAEQASDGTPIQINDLIFKGSILSLDEGSVAERVAIGFGSGASELKVHVAAYQMTAQGLRQLGGGTGDAGGGKSPGAALGAAGAIATANPAGLIISTGMKVYGEASGSSKVEGRAKQIVEEIVSRVKPKFQQQGWIN